MPTYPYPKIMKFCYILGQKMTKLSFFNGRIIFIRILWTKNEFFGLFLHPKINIIFYVKIVPTNTKNVPPPLINWVTL